jgi:ribosome-associated translation inhibitor RaiA
VRLHTDRGLFMASGEGYGARSALDDARDALERQLRDHKGRERDGRRFSEADWERRFGWWLEG